ncbi:hypothetical protein XCR_0946 [Xanthomonas campestris pv. raphani 756C]|nr:hypothetical protein XCR_0946 [Xanthomonas campestris pv. raphani 756C]
MWRRAHATAQAGFGRMRGLRASPTPPADPALSGGAGQLVRALRAASMTSRTSLPQ